MTNARAWFYGTSFHDHAGRFDIHAAARRLHVNNVTTRERIEQHDWATHVAAQEREGNEMATNEMKRVLDARTPLILAAIDLGEVVCSAMTAPSAERDGRVNLALRKTEDALRELARAWVATPIASARPPLAGEAERVEAVAS